MKDSWGFVLGSTLITRSVVSMPRVYLVICPKVPANTGPHARRSQLLYEKQHTGGLLARGECDMSQSRLCTRSMWCTSFI